MTVRRALLRAPLVAAALVALSASPALAKELRVSNDNSCPNAQYTSIQAAVTAASTGDTVKVCPGTYPEQVRVNNAGNNRDRLKIESLKPWQAKVTYPVVTTPPNSIFEVSQSQDVTISGFTITGPYDVPGCAGALDRHYGVRVDGGGDANILGSHITKIRDVSDALNGCQDGVAILVGRQFEGQTGSADIVGNVIDDYAKNGPTIDNSGSSARISANAIDGGGPTTLSAKNGVQVGRGASADVFANSITRNSYVGVGPPAPSDTDTSSDSVGILVFSETDGVTIANNYSAQNDLGVDVGTASGVLVRNNVTDNNVFDGLRAESDTQQNTFAENRSNGNGTHDCHDDSHGTGTAGTANTWKHDQGVTQTPPGICTRGRDH